MWFREGGPVSHEGFADIVMTMIEAGANTLAEGLTNDGPAKIARPGIRSI